MKDFSARRFSRRQFAALLSLGAGLAAAGAARAADDPSNLLYMQLKDGMVVIRMRPDLAPKHVARIKTLVKRGFYNGVVFHRVIEGFMAQTGDP
ncbi:peptidylprolyl isomerase, partial [Rhodoblastus sp.]